MTAQARPALEDCVNDVCPWSGKPVAADALTLYRGRVVGFCNPGCRDTSERAVEHFEAALARQDNGQDHGRPSPL
jgi:hypothetical protein